MVFWGAVYLCLFVFVLGVQMKLVGYFGGRWRLLKTVRGRKDGFSGGFCVDKGFWGMLEDGGHGLKGCVEAPSGIRGMVGCLRWKVRFCFGDWRLVG